MVEAFVILLFVNTLISGFALAGFVRNNRHMERVQDMYSRVFEVMRSNTSRDGSIDG